MTEQSIGWEWEVCRATATSVHLLVSEDSPSYGKPKLLEQLRQALQVRHYSRRTEQTYVFWVRRFIFFHGVRHPAETAELEINAFLTHLAVKERVSASTQNQALAASVCHL